MRKKNNDNFMTEKEKSYIAHYLEKNLTRQIKQKDYSIFFSVSTETSDNKEKEKAKNIKKSTRQEKTTTHEKEEKNNTLVKELDNVSIKPKANTKKVENKDDTNVKKQSLKEILKTSFIRTSKKSRKKPRIIVKQTIPLSETLSYKLKIEKLCDAIVLQNYCTKNKDPEMIISEDDFFYFLDIPKFFNFACDFFSTYNDSSKSVFLQSLLKYAIKIHDLDILESFLSKTYMNFPVLLNENILVSEYFDSFYFNVSNVVLAKYLLMSNENYVSLFYDCLSNDNLELIFSLDNDYKAWHFLAVFIVLLNDDRQAVIVSLLKEKILETVHCDDDKKIEGLTLFLDAIGIDKKDLQ